MKKKIIITSITAIILAIALCCFYIANQIYTQIYIEHTLLEIKPGSTGRTIASLLFEENVIRNERVFLYLLRYKEADAQIHAGHYLFIGNLNMLEVIEKLAEGGVCVASVRITIPEGLSIFRTLMSIAEQGVGSSYEDLLTLAECPEFARDVTGMEIDTLEGFLYPDTYVFNTHMSDASVLKMMVSNFFQRMESRGICIVDKEQFYRDMILASIVEREVAVRSEMPMVASVFLNRLRIGMRLQADPTVVYHKERDFIHVERVLNRMLRYPSPFNTYYITGLPPSPICSPSSAALHAVQNPANTQYLFFVANTDLSGRHIFTRTYAEHLRYARLWWSR
jgi:UPF0755 protein